MPSNSPGEVEIVSSYSKHLGPRVEGAGLRIQFHYNQEPGIHFKVQPPEEYRDAIIKGITEGLKERFPSFPKNGAVWINEVFDNQIDSSERAFYRAGRLAIEQAFALTRF